MHVYSQVHNMMQDDVLIRMCKIMFQTYYKVHEIWRKKKKKERSISFFSSSIFQIADLLSGAVNSKPTL